MIYISRPAHKHYALRSVSNETYIKFVNGYSLAKKIGIRSVWSFILGSGLYEVCMEFAKGEVRKYGRRKFGSAILGCLTWIGTPIVPLITNSTKVIRIANATHTTIAFIAESAEDISNATWLPLDLLLTGQVIPIGKAGRFNLMGGDFSILNDLID